MTRYFSTFASGFDNLAARFLAADLGDADGIEKLDGALVYESNAAPAAIRAIKYFKNSFIVLQTLIGVKDIAKAAARANTKNIEAPAAARSFRLVFSDENELVSVDGAVKAKLIDAIWKKTKLSYHAAAADVEFALHRRRNGAVFFLQRITKNSAATAEAGELDPHVAELLCRATEPAANDVFIDPFCGRGALPLARAHTAPYRGIFATDIDAELTGALKAKIRAIKNSKIQKSFFVKTGDFFQNQFDDNFADAIVTDPPWGSYQKIGGDFYANTMNEFARILKPGGRLVVLTAREMILPPHEKLTRAEKFDVLIHGKKATVHIYRAN